MDPSVSTLEKLSQFAWLQQNQNGRSHVIGLDEDHKILDEKA